MYNEVRNFEAGWVAETSSSDIVASLIRMLKERSQITIYSKNAIKLAGTYGWDL